MFNPFAPVHEQKQHVVDPAAYESQLRSMPSYEVKAEFISQIGKGWDDLPRPKLKSAIQALIQRRVGAKVD
jgi:hypothetical protein